MKKLALSSLAILLAFAGVCRADGPPPKEVLESADKAKMQRAIDGMYETFDMLDKSLGGLTADEKAKVTALAAKLEADLKADPTLNESRNREVMEEKMITGYRAALSDEHAKKFDEFVAKAKKTSEKSYNAASVSGICKAINIYASDESKLPAGLGELVTKGFCGPKQFVKKGGNTKLPDGISKMDPKEQAKWVSDNSDYVYLGAGRDIAKLDTNFVLVYDKEGTIFGCADGHVPVLKADEAAKVFEELKAGKNPPPTLKDK